ncbi:hypothetical protein P43SY_006338 [Pythium insidiosum]|uniref:RING-type E3 ubiquitin transferase BRCA1 n=1 Tax=Pythium insidiosum TaxID=114742 RepID=A0AAD5Q2M6_PYTIN|nr:hypothetical protein P43SY_006338 [Pythium insidiosum]
MDMLNEEQRDSIRMIREQLCCLLCDRVFEDPQCLDCKHNFCRECIHVHLKKRENFCPKCTLPTCPSEVTRNQFLQSILVAWKAVEQELHALEHPEDDTDGPSASASAAAAAAASSDPREQRRKSEFRAASDAVTSLLPRGPVGPSKWNIDTSELRQEAARAASAELSSAFGSLAQRAAAKSAALTASSSTCPSPSQTQLPPSQSQSQSQSQTQLPWGSANGNTNGVALPSRPRSPPRAVLASPASAAESPMAMLGTQDLESLRHKLVTQTQLLQQWQQSKDTAHVERHTQALRVVPTISAVERMKQLQSGLPRRSPPTPTRKDDGDSPDLLGIATPETPSRRPRREAAARATRQISQEAAMDPERLRGDEADDDVEEDEDSDGGMRRRHKRVRRSLALPMAERADRRPEPARREGLSNGVVVAASPLRPARSERRPAAVPRIFVPSSQAIEVVDMTQDDEEEEEEIVEQGVNKDHRVARHDTQDGDDEEVEESQLPAMTALPQQLGGANGSLQERARVSEDFRGAITAFHRSTRLHRLSGGTDVFSSPPSSRSSAARRPPLPPLPPSPMPAPPTAAREMVFVGTDLTREEAKAVLLACQRLGGRFGREFDLQRDPITGALASSVTHLITKACPLDEDDEDEDEDEEDEARSTRRRRCKRTAKYMRALAEGVWIVDVSWVRASLAAGRWVREKPFELVGDIYSDAVGKPRESRLRRQRTGRRSEIFSGLEFVLLCPPATFDFQIESLRAIVSHFGASVEWSSDYESRDPSARPHKPVGIVSKTLEPKDAEPLWAQYSMPIVRVTWIFDSISHVRLLPFDDYYPY